MERLYLTCAKSRFLYGYRRPQIISTYLKDLDFEKPYKSIDNYSNFDNKRYNSFDYNNSEEYTPKNTDYVKSVTQIKVNSVSDKDFNVGDKVSHTKFGEGIIVSINGDVGKIAFKGVGVKELMLNLAPLTKI